MNSGNQADDLASAPQTSPNASEQLRRQRSILIGVIVGAVVLLAILVVSFYYLFQPQTDTAKIRDVFIIFMALESLLLGLVLVVLIIQLARLINLLQNEIRPILDSTNETVNTLRGTTIFLSENVVEPVIKMNEYSAGILQALTVLGLLRRRSKK